MIEGWLETQRIAEQKADVNQILELAKRSYENYLIRSSEKDLDSAANYYLKALKMLYKSVEEDVKFLSYKLRGAMQVKFKNYDKALKIYEDAVKKTGKEDVFYSEIADLLLKKGNHAQACKYYKNAIKASPCNIILWVNLVKILQTYYKDNTDELMHCYDNMIELEPDNAALYHELGYLYLKTDEKFSAANAFKRAVELESNNAFYYNSYAYALMQLEDYDGAIMQYQNAIRLNPDNEWTSIVAQALGAIYYEVKSNVDAAMIAYQTAIAFNPSNADAFVAIGEIHQEKNNLASAIKNYCEAIRINPAISKAYCNMGLALWEKGYADEAIIAYQKATVLDPDHAIAFNNLGVIFLDEKQKPLDALVQFTQAIEANPNYVPAYYNKGRAYNALNNKIQAAKYYQMAIDINKFTNEIDESEVENRLYDLFSVC